MDKKIDSLILGDNQFFGVNHISEDKGRITLEKFRDLSEIKKIMYCAIDNGVTGVMFSTHPTIYQITDMMRKDPALKNNLSIYVNVPYIVKYIRMVSTMGAYKTINTMLEGKTLIGKLKYFANSAYNFVTNDYLNIANRLIDVELNPFYDLNVKCVFLHNVLTDLAVGYDMVNVIKNFNNYISKKYKVNPAYITFNYPLLCNILHNAGIENSIVMTSVNKKGFLVSPSKEACEEAINKNQHQIIAMATLASGCIPPEEAYEYVFSMKSIKSVIVGVSSEKHAKETFKVLHKYLG